MRENYGGFGSERQTATYLAGAVGRRPRLPLLPDRLEAAAQKVMTPEAFDYVSGGGGTDDTVRANTTEFGRWFIVPRMMTDVKERDTRVELFGERLPAPVLLAPVGALGIVHPEAELAVARAAASMGIPMVASTLTLHSLEEIGSAMGPGHRWFQLYWGPDRDVNLSLVQRAEKAGYSVLIVTLDTRILGWRPRDLENGYLPFLSGAGIRNYLTDPVFLSRLDKPPEEDLTSAVRRALGLLGDPSFVWEDIRFLCERTRLPVVVKGILHPQDAVSAMEAGANGIIVSNHGGRQVGGSLPALRALPSVVAEVGRRVPVLFDSGVRCGADVVKALCLGAQAVLLGRPYVWGLALEGEDGVRQVVEDLLADFDLTMALAGRSKLSDLTREMVAEA